MLSLDTAVHDSHGQPYIFHHHSKNLITNNFLSKNSLSLMGSIHKHIIYNHESQPLSPPQNHQTPSYQAPLPTSSPPDTSSFPILAIAFLCIMATSFILVTCYIFLSKRCFNWQQLDPLRRFSLSRTTQDPLTAYSPSLQSHGLDEFLIRDIPTFQYTSRGDGVIETGMYKCVVCLSEFQEKEMMRVLPNCGHVFHLDCIDIWLQSNANCPVCRSSISGTRKSSVNRIIAPTTSPQDSQPFSDTHLGGDEDFVVIELGGDDRAMILPQERSESRRKVKSRKFHHVSIMGDECIDVRERDDPFGVQPIRRSFSLDSAADPKVYLQVQEIIRENEIRNGVEESSSRVRRPFFSFGHARGSRSAVLPIEF